MTENIELAIIQAKKNRKPKKKQIEKIEKVGKKSDTLYWTGHI